MPTIRTAVFPVAGRGTRFLPATKASPKEMLPIVDKPLIQYAVEEAMAAGAERLVFVTGASKRAIEDHFDTDAELERQLAESGKDNFLALVNTIPPASLACMSGKACRSAWATRCYALATPWATSRSSSISPTT